LKNFYLIGTPLGNLGDMTPRAVETLRLCQFLYAEDTRSARKLLSHFGLSLPVESCHQHNEEKRAQTLAAKFEDFDHIGYISDAGMPVLSDPGARLAATCHELGIPVTPIPGPSAGITALAVSGFTAQPVTFWGFLPSKPKARECEYERMEQLGGVHILFVGPHHAEGLLAELGKRFAGQRLCIARELTKIHEEVLVCTLPDLPEFNARGEFTLVLELAAAKKPEAENSALLHLSSKDHLLALIQEHGVEMKQAIQLVASARGLPKKEIYRLSLDIKGLLS
jgi:16S rRNA (cytidine1402-2'-O)-methyltransferase